MKKLIFSTTKKKLTQKCLRISSSLVIIFAWTGSSLSRQTLMLRWYLYAISNMVLNWYRWRSEMYPCTPSSFKIGIPNMLLASCNACDIKMWLHQQFFTFQTLKNKQHKFDELTDMIDFGEFPSLSLESLLLLHCNMYVIFMMIIWTINQVQAWMSYDVKCLPKRIRGGRLSPTLDVLSLDLRRTLIFFLLIFV